MARREPWYESDNPRRLSSGVFRHVAAWVIGLVLLAGAISGGIWAFKVGFSGPKGAGDQTRITNDGRNRVNAQEWFQGQYGQILAADRNLDQAAANLNAHPSGDDHDFYLTNYTGLKNRCVDMVTAYNAEALKVSRAQWRDPALPQHIDDSDTTTDCKESK